MNIFTNNPLRLLAAVATVYGFCVKKSIAPNGRTHANSDTPISSPKYSVPHALAHRIERTYSSSSHKTHGHGRFGKSAALSLSPSLCGTLAARALFWALVLASLFGIRNRNRIIRAHITRTRFGACARECERASECESNNTAERNGTKKSGPAREPARASTAAVRGSENQSEM